MLKRCTKCKVEQPPSESFHRNARSRDGLEARCKKCRSIRGKELYDFGGGKATKANYDKTEKAKEAKANYKQTENGRKASLRATEKYNAKNPLKRKAQGMISSHIQSGKIIPRPCGVCGEVKTDAHHSDYSKPLEVMWLCRKDHKKWHQEHGEGLNG